MHVVIEDISVATVNGLVRLDGLPTGAEVTLDGSHASFQAIASPHGLYTITDIPAGHYEVVLRLNNLVYRESMELAAGQVKRAQHQLTSDSHVTTQATVLSHSGRVLAGRRFAVTQPSGLGYWSAMSDATRTVRVPFPAEQGNGAEWAAL